MGMSLPWRSLVASLASLGVHLGFAAGVIGWVSRIPAPAPAPMPYEDVWSGTAVEVDSVGADEHSSSGEVDQSSNTAAPGEPGEPTQERPAPPSPAAEPVREPPKERPSRVRPSAPSNEAALDERAAESKTPRRVPSPVEAALAAGEASFRGAQGTEQSGAAPEASSGPSSFGAEGLPPGMRHLPKAFARALPPAGKADKGWLELPLGLVGELTFDVVVDEQGKLGELVYVDPKASQRQPAPLRRMVERGLLMLRSGTFSLAPSARESGRQRLKIEAQLTQVEEQKEALSFEAPAPGRPGRSVFVLTSGLRMEARISLVP